MASYSNTNTTFLDYTGNWSVSTDTHVPGSFFHFTETTGSSVSTTFGGSSAVVLQGIVNWGNWQYTVVRVARLILKPGSLLVNLSVSKWYPIRTQRKQLLVHSGYYLVL